MRLDESHDLPQIRLDKSYNLIVPKIDLGISSSIRLIYKFVKFLIETSNKVNQLKTYNKAVDNPIHKNK